MSQLPFPVPSDVDFHDGKHASTLLGGDVPVNINGVARPKTQNEVRSVMKWANDNEIRLLPISSPFGPRRFGAAGVNSPIVILDMSAMADMIHADGRDGIAVIEPGLTFLEFDARLASYGMRSLKPFLPRRGKSVLACFLEREPITSHNDHWDTTDPLASMSMVFGNAQPFVSGGASVPGELKKNLDDGLRQMMASGPIGTDYSRVVMGAQGTLGVVCWASVYCEKIPALERDYLFSADTPKSLLAVVRELSLRKLGSHCFILSRSQLAAAISDDRVSFDHQNKSLPEWSLFVKIGAPDFMPEKAIAWKAGDLDKIVKSNGVIDESAKFGEALSELSSRLQRPPETYFKSVPRGEYKDVFCLTEMSNVENLVGIIKAVTGQHSSVESGIYIQPTIQGVSCHVEVSIFQDSENASGVDAIARELFQQLSDNGGFFSRPYGEWAEDTYARNPAIVPHLKTVKKLFDPQGVLSPGRLCY